MRQIRFDKLTGDKAIYVTMRSKRPLDPIIIPEDDSIKREYNEQCPFCRGNEGYVEEEKFVIDRDGSWTSKSVANKFPIVVMESDEVFGRHEVIIDTYRHNGSFFDMTNQEFKDMFTVYSQRYKELIKEEGIVYASIFKNFRREAGASLNHPHSQIVSLSMIPPEVEKEIRVFDSYWDKNAKNLHDEIIKEESENIKRVIYEGDYFICFIPDATRYNREIRIMAKVNINLDDFKEDILEELVYLFKNLFTRIYDIEGYLPFNILLHTVPKDYEDMFRLHFHIVPRRFNFGGFELSTNLFVCSSDPEAYAKQLKFK